MSKQSLFAQSRSSAPPASEGTGIAVPAPSSMTAVHLPEQTGPSSAYVWFAGQKSQRWSEFSSKFPGLKQNDPILIPMRGEPIHLGSSVTFFLLDAYQYYAQLDGEFHVARAWTKLPTDASGARAREFITLFAVVMLEADACPCLIRVSDAMCQGAHAAIRAATKDVLSADWGTRSAEHAASMAVPQPHLRFMTRLTWSPRKSRAGYTYNVSQASIVPTSAGAAKVIAESSATADFKAEMDAAKASFDSWRRSVEAKM